MNTINEAFALPHPPSTTIDEDEDNANKEEENEDWCCDKLINLTKKVTPEQKICVLVSTGALSPIHHGHVEMMEAAKRGMEQEGYTVIGGFISPSHDLYVGGKLGSRALPAAVRVECVRRAVAATDWLEVGCWESNQLGYWPDFPEVAKSLRTHLTTQEKINADVMFVCGGDHFLKCHLQRGLDPSNRIGVVVVPREGARLGGQPSGPKLVFVAAQANKHLASLSSTKVRHAVENNSLTTEMVHPGVLRLLVPQQQQQQRRARCVFVSLSCLARQWKTIPKHVLDEALFFFGSRRSWLFPETAEERAESLQQPTPYLNLPRALVEIIVEKERKGEVCFLKRDGLVGDYGFASKWFASCFDPLSGKNYNPLRLDKKWWLSKEQDEFFFHSSATSVINNFQRGDHDYNATMELVAQSNTTVWPCAMWRPSDANRLCTITDAAQP